MFGDGGDERDREERGDEADRRRYSALTVGAYVIMVGRTVAKLNKVVDELAGDFQRRGRELPRDRILTKHMDFGDPPAVEKNFQNVR